MFEGETLFRTKVCREVGCLEGAAISRNGIDWHELILIGRMD